MGRKITILGMGATASQRRYDIEKYCAGTEIWGLNNGYITYPQLAGKWSRYFELHFYNYTKSWDAGCINGQRVDHFASLNSLGCPVYAIEPLPVVCNQHQFDLLKYSEHFGTNYFLGSPSLMLVQALYEHDHGQKIDEIRSWGIDTSDPTHSQQRASWAFWISQVISRRINITGTASDFMGEYEKDDGLRGLREKIGDRMQARKEQIEKQHIANKKAADETKLKKKKEKKP